MYCCPHCKSKVKTKSSLNRHLKEACKVLKNANRRRPTSEIQLGSPSGASQLSALGNPEYLPPAFTANATIESVTCELNNFDGLSPLKFTPQKRSGVHKLKRNPWHDWAMVRYEVESNQGIMKSYDVACKVCLWGIFRNNNAAPDDSSDHLDVYGAFHPMKEYEPQKDKTLPFITKDRLADNVEILSFDTVVSTAYVLPMNWSRIDPFPQSRQETTTYCVIPPRASWPDLGWDDKLLQRKEMQDTNKLPFI